MADVKISALPASTTPLAGTEVLPIVQSSTTRQVSVANLTAGRAVSALSIATTTGATFATTSGSVGIGTASPATFSVGGTPVLVVGNNAQTQITLYGGSNVGDINFATSSSGAGLYSGVVRYDGTSNFMSFWTSSTERMRITSAGVLDIGTGAGAIGQIQFPATAVPSANANTLDDYEEGTWTPNDQSGASLSFTVYDATYTKIGRLVQVQASITYPSTASTLDAQIGGLPFTAANGTDNTGGICFSGTNANLSFTGLIARNNTKFYLETITGASVTNLNMSSKYIKFFGSYIV